MTPMISKYYIFSHTILSILDLPTEEDFLNLVLLILTHILSGTIGPPATD